MVVSNGPTLSGIRPGFVNESMYRILGCWYLPVPRPLLIHSLFTDNSKKSAETTDNR